MKTARSPGASGEGEGTAPLPHALHLLSAIVCLYRHYWHVPALALRLLRWGTEVQEPGWHIQVQS